MDVRKRTPRLEAEWLTLLRRLGPVLEDLTDETGADQDVLDNLLSTYARLSVRVDWNGDGVDFKPLALSDSDKVLKKKALAYLDSQCIEQIDAAREALRVLDAPADLATAPEPPDEADAGN